MSDNRLCLSFLPLLEGAISFLFEVFLFIISKYNNNSSYMLNWTETNFLLRIIFFNSYMWLFLKFFYLYVTFFSSFVYFFVLLYFFSDLQMSFSMFSHFFIYFFVFSVICILSICLLFLCLCLSFLSLWLTYFDRYTYFITCILLSENIMVLWLLLLRQ